MAGRVEEHPDIVLRLVISERHSEFNCPGDRRVEVSDLHVKVHHRALLPIGGRPHGCLVTGRLHPFPEGLRRPYIDQIGDWCARVRVVSRGI